MSGKLTKAQRAQLENLATWKMPRSMAAHGWPGFPERLVDMRSMGPLQKAGYVEAGVHQYESPSGSEVRSGIWWRITDAGRSALRESP
jgi:hypothetical protein